MKYLLSLVCCCLAAAAHGASCDRTTDDGLVRECYLRTLDCTALTNTSDRLACYDRIYQQSASMGDVVGMPGTNEIAEVGSEKAQQQQSVPAETPVIDIEPAKTPENQVPSDEERAAGTDNGEPAEIAEQPVPAQAPTTVVSTPVTPPEKQVTTEEEKAAATEDNYPDEITASIVSTRKDITGAITLSLSNDQVWRELDPSRLRYKAGDTVVIKKGMLKRYKLRINGEGLSCQVRRIK